MLRFVAVMLGMLVLAAPLHAQDKSAISAARGAIARDDPETAETLLTAACETGDRDACWTLGLLIAANPDGGQRAAARFAANCDAGDLKSCYYYGQSLGNWPDADEAARAAVQPLLARACDGGLGYACTRLGRALAETEPAGNAPQAVAAFDKGCRLGAAASCSEAGQRRAHDAQTPYFDLLVAAEQLGMACDLGIDAACGVAAALRLGATGLPLREMAPEALVRMRANLRKSCLAGKDDDCRTMLAGELEFD
jgi:hypothetical protein